MQSKTYNFLILFLLNSILQLLDGLLTYIGVTLFGSEAEGNYLIRYLIETIGLELGLIIPKITAIALIYFLYRQINKNSIVEKCLYVLLGFYLAVVITWILSLIASSQDLII